MEHPPAIGIGKLKIFHSGKEAEEWFKQHENKVSIINASVAFSGRTAFDTETTIILVVYEEREWTASQEPIFDPRER
jgi:hypothetical protein